METINPLEPRGHTHVREIQLDSTPYLADHRVNEQVVFPGAGFAEIALGAVSGKLTLRDTVFKQPLILSPGKRVRLELELSADESESRAFQFTIRSEKTHAAGLILPGIPSVPERDEFFRAEAPPSDKTVTASTFYAMFRARGIEYGPEFRMIREFRNYRDEFAAARVGLPLSAAGCPGRLVLMDACFQTALALISRGTFIPAGFESLVWYGNTGIPVLVKARLTHTQSPAARLADVIAFDDQDRPVLLIRGMRLRALSMDTRVSKPARPRFPETIQPHERGDALRDLLREELADIRRVPASEVPLESIKLDSLAVLELRNRLRNRLGLDLPTTMVWNYPTIPLLVDFLEARLEEEAGETIAERDDSPTVIPRGPRDSAKRTPAKHVSGNSMADGIAVVGMACRFPGGAADPESFWRVLHEDGDVITEVPSSRWDPGEYFRENASGPGESITRWGGFLDQVDGFDPSFFGITPREAMHMDPQQRILLETAWDALEYGGFAADIAGSPTGVFVGFSTHDYSLGAPSDPRRVEAYDNAGSLMQSILANRISYLLDLRGPSMSVDTACSSSLTAVHLACRALRMGDANLALAGGVNLILSPLLHVSLTRWNMMSPDGHCRTFDAGANGFVRGEGCGLVVLKRLQDALEDNDNILAVIQGTAVNQDGRTNGLTAPRGPAQEAVIRRALEDAGMEPGEISSIEAHGTGTPLGDPIEVEALMNVYGRSSRACALSSVKTSIGHLEAAAGIAGLIKAVLTLQKGSVPPHQNLRTLNPEIRLDESRFFIPREARTWPEGYEAKAAAVSSFGAGGTNAHAILREAPARERPFAPERDVNVLLLSAHNEPTLRAVAESFAGFLEQKELPAALSEICRTAALKRTHHKYRLSVAGRDAGDMAQRLRRYLSDGRAPGVFAADSARKRKTVFVYCGQGPQWWAMGRELYAGNETFRRCVEEINAHAREYLEQDLIRIWLECDERESRLNETAFAQPVLFTLQIALTQCLEQYGIKPDAVVGHSAGEIAAACASGILSLQDAVRLICRRGALMQQAHGRGAMAVVELSEERAREISAKHTELLGIAAVNAPDSVVLAGDTGALHGVLNELESRNVGIHRLHVDYAFHSPMMTFLSDSMRAISRDTRTAPGRIPFISTVTGRRLERDQMEPEYWANNMLETVHFARAIANAASEEACSFLEIGPQPVLSASIQSVLASGFQEQEHITIPTLRRGQAESEQLLAAAARLHCEGHPVNRRGMFQGEGPPIPLPGYAWQRESFWRTDANQFDEDRAGEDGVGRKAAPAKVSADRGDLYTLEWRETAWTASTRSPGGILLIGDEGDFIEAFIASESEHEKTPVIRAEEAGHYLMGREDIRHILYAAPLDGGRAEEIIAEALNFANSLLFAREAVRNPPAVWFLTRGAQGFPSSLHGVNPEHAALWGWVRSLILEEAGFPWGLLDLDPEQDMETSARTLRATLAHTAGRECLLLRGQSSYAARLIHRLEAAGESPPVLSSRYGPSDGCWIIGGAGGLGKIITRRLLEEGVRNFMLTGRRPPDGEIRNFLTELESRGARAHYLAVDSRDTNRMREVPLECERLGWVPRGVVHAAGEMRAESIRETTRESLEKTLAPKTLGGRNLIEAFRDRSVDFILFCSSSASIFGGANYASYAAANSFLDGLAHLGRKLGLPTQSINWSFWEKTGLSSPTLVRELETIGFRPLAPTRALELWARARARGLIQAGAMNCRWTEFRELHESRTAERLFAEFSQSRSETPSGTDRDTHSGETHSRKPLKNPRSVPLHDREDFILQSLMNECEIIMGVAPDPRPGLFAQGMDSLMAVRLIERINSGFTLDLKKTTVLEYPSLRAIASHVFSLLDSAPVKRDVPRQSAKQNAVDEEGIAVVGMACRFPGDVDSPESFWELLRAGRDAIGPIPPDRRDMDALHDPDVNAAGKINVKEGGFLKAVDEFDAAFFGISPREAAKMDPQQRMVLETAWEALESAGIPPERHRDTRGAIYIGVTLSDYLDMQKKANPGDLDLYTGTGGHLNAIAGRLAYVLGWQGPCAAVDAACASSLVSVHLACKSLRAGEAEIALAGGVNLMLQPDSFIYMSRSGSLAPDGRCRPFSEDAGGFGRSEGCGIVALKKATAALRDGDEILAIIRGGALGQDGASAGLTVPSGSAQRKLIETALEDAGTAAEEVDYVEAHGTGTILGDPMEASALAATYGKQRQRPLYVSSCKANIGHTESAAGIAGLIKTILSLRHERIPGNPHLKKLNSRIETADGRLVFPAREIPWNSGRERVAAVSSFGISGSLAHVIVAAGPGANARRNTALERKVFLLPLSARDPEALRELSGAYLALLERESPSLHDLCFSAALTRDHHDFRVCPVFRSRDELREILNRISSGREHPNAPGGRVSARVPGLVFLFSDAEDTYSLARPLSEPFLSAQLEARKNMLIEFAGFSMPEEDEPPRTPKQEQMAEFALQLSLAQLWREYGMEPGTLIARGTGEYAAAAFAGILSEKDALSALPAFAPGRNLALAPAVIPLYSERAGGSSGRVLGLDDFARFERDAGDQPRHFIELGPGPSSPAVRGRAEWKVFGGREDYAAHETESFHHALAGLYASGRNPNWSALYPSGRRISLPRYPWQRKSFWFTPSTTTKPRQEPAIVREFEPGPRDIPYIAEHRIQGRVLVPGPMFMQYILQTAQEELPGPGAPILREIKFLNALFPEQDGSRLRITLKPRGDGSHECEIHSRADDAWTLNCSAIFLREGTPNGNPNNTPTTPPDEIARTLKFKFDSDSFYSALTEGGVEYGPSFRSGAETIYRDKGRALREIRARFPTEDEPQFPMHPALLDISFQTMLAAIPSSGTGDEFVFPGGFVLEALEEFALIRSPGAKPFWSYARLESEEPGICQVDLFDEHGEILAHARGIRIRFLEHRAKIEDFLFESRLIEPPPSKPGPLPGSILIVSEDGELARSLESELGDPGIRVLKTSEPDRAHELVRQLPPHAAILYAPGTIADLNDSRPGVTEQATALLNTIRTLALAADAHSETRLWSAIPGEGRTPNLKQTMLQGFARSLAAELPDAFGRLMVFDTAPSDPAYAQLIVDELRIPDEERFIEYRGMIRSALRLDRARLTGAATRSKTLRGTCLITGGLGDLGMESVLHLAGQGMTHFVLLGRSGLEDMPGEKRRTRESQLRELKATGTRVHIIKADAGNREELTEALATIPEEMPDIRVIIHAAGVGGLRSIRDLSEDDIRIELKGKAEGAHNLHAVFEDRLDHFILYSSAAVLIDSPFAAAYAAANAFLDGLAALRRAKGWAALSINWGFWNGIGMAAREYENRNGNAGIKAMSPAHALKALDLLMERNPARCAVMDFNPAEFQRAYPQSAGASCFRLLAAPLDKMENAKIETFGSTSPRVGSDVLEDYLARQMADVLALSADSLDRETSLRKLGFDSLMAMELRARADRDLGVRIPTIDFLRGYSLRELVRHTVKAETDTHVRAEPEIRVKSNASTEAGRPLSYSQESYWIFSRMVPDSPVYINHMTLEMRGPLDESRLGAALGKVIGENQILRTVFPISDTGPMQTVLEKSPHNLQKIDLRSPVDESAAEASRLITADASRPFEDQRSSPPARFSLLRLAKDHYIFMAALHHIICDGISMAAFFAKLADAYAQRPGEAPPIQYADYAIWQRERIAGETLKKGLAFWRRTLTGLASAPPLPYDHPRGEASFRGNVARRNLPDSLPPALEELARKEEATLFMITAAVLGRLMKDWSGQSDIVLGTVASERDRPEFRDALGDFTNFLPLRLDIRDQENFLSLLRRSGESILAAFEHRHIPFSFIVRETVRERRAERNPIYNTAILLHDLDKSPRLNFGPELKVEADYKTRDLARTAVLDLRFELMKSDGRLRIDCEYNADAFEASTIENLLDDFEAGLNRALEESGITNAGNEKSELLITATFTANLLNSPLQYWLDHGELSMAPRFGDYNQIFQSLLKRNEHSPSVQVILTRFEDWLGRSANDAIAKLEENVEELIRAFAAARRESDGDYLCVVCPSAPKVQEERRKDFMRMEARIRTELEKLDVRFFSTTEVLAYLPSNYHDDEMNKLGHIPYTEEAFTGLAALIARRVHALRGTRRKVIALDCDNTLWGGVAGEDGPEGISLDARHRHLQEFMMARESEGMLLVLCSKNNEADVREVFAERADFPLKGERIAARAINWKPKDENLEELARELNLGLDSFIFIDDSPLECARIRESLPEVLVLELPEDGSRWSALLENTWAFDRLSVTEEDRRRTELYRGEAKRRELRGNSYSYEEFLANLKLKTEFRTAGSTDLARATQLTRRTNQFNCSTIRRDEAAMARIISDEDMEVILVGAADRFGDYGTVGLVITLRDDDALVVDTFLLSCRALGRGVEHRMLDYLKAKARSGGMSRLNINYAPTEKNKPARDFLAQVGEIRETHEGLAFAVAPGESSADGNDLTEITKRIHEFQMAKNMALDTRDASIAVPTPENELEQSLLDAWSKVLAKSGFGVEDNFFQLGGNSLAATQLSSSRSFHVPINLNDFFEQPTIRGIASVILDRQARSLSTPELREVLEEILRMDQHELQTAIETETARYRKGET